MTRHCTAAQVLHDALAIGLALTLAIMATGLGGLLQPAAADDETAYLTIEANDENAGVTYAAYRVFSGNVRSDGTMSDITWQDDATRTAVVTAITAFSPTYTDASSASESAQDAAEYIAEHIGDADGTSGGTAPSTSTSVIVAADSFAATLAAELADAAEATSVPANTRTALEAGWYLIVTDSSSIASGASGTSAVFTLLAAGENTVTEKADTPTLAKTVYEDSTASWGAASDANAGQSVRFRLEGTVPANVSSYNTYAYTFTDTLASGLVLDESSVAVKLVDGSSTTTVTSAFSVTTTSSSLVATCEDITAIDGLEGGMTLRVEYTASLAEGCTLGSAGNENTAYITYSSNPNTDATATSVASSASVYTYALTLHKQDANKASRSLSGAKFTLMVASTNSDEDSAGLYVQADGTLGSEAYEFETDSSGNITIANIDEGTYILSETVTPTASDGSSYAAIEDTVITVTSNIEALASGEADELVLSATSSDGSVVIADSVASDGTTDGSGVDAASGTVTAVVLESKQSAMPSTGEVAALLLVVAGLAIAALGTALATRSRRRSGENGQA